MLHDRVEENLYQDYESNEMSRNELNFKKYIHLSLLSVVRNSRCSHQSFHCMADALPITSKYLL